MKSRIQLLFLLLFLSNISVSAQWTQYNNLPSTDNYSVRALDSSFYYASGWLRFNRSINSGATWDTLKILDLTGTEIPGTGFYDVYFLNSTDGIAVGMSVLGNSEAVFRTNNGGFNWSIVSVYNSGTWPRLQNAIHFTSSTTGYTAGTNGRVLKTTDAGTSWSALTTSTTSSLYDVFFVTPNTGYAVGNNVILRTGNAGSSWSTQTFSGTKFNSVHFPTTILGYAVGDNHKIYKTVNSGVNWTQLTVNIPGPIDFTQVHFTSATTGYVTGGNQIYKTTDGGIYWEKYEGTDPMNYVYFRSANHGFAAGDAGQLLHTVNGDFITTPVSYFTASPTTSCNDSIIQLNNLSNPAWNYQWLNNGVPFSTSYNATLTISNPGQTDTISLVADNGNYKDTFDRNIYIQPSLDFVLSPVVTDDTICINQSGQIKVFNSISGITYKLRNGITQIGSTQNGNGGTLTFSTGAMSVTTTYNIYATKTITGCGSYSKTSYHTIHIGNPDISLTVTASPMAICYNQSTTVILSNSVPGVDYQLKKGTTNVGSPQIGNGGTLTFSTGPVPNTMTFNIAATSQAGCTSTLTNTVSISVERPLTYYTLNTFNPEIGEPVSTLNTSNYPGGSYIWTFSNGATPATANTMDVSGVVFSVQGQGTVKLKLTSPSGCKDSVSKTIYVVAPVDDSCNVINWATKLAISDAELYCLDHDSDDNLYTFNNLDYTTREVTYSNHGDSIITNLPNITNYNQKYSLVKYNKKGLPQWSTKLRFGTSWPDTGTLRCDSLGNVYVAYFHMDHTDSLRIYSSDEKYITINPPTTSSPSRQSIVVIKYNSMGIYQWHFTFLDFYWLDQVSLEIDQLGNIFASGEESMVKANSSGNILWWKQNGEYVNVLPDNNGGVYSLNISQGIFNHFDTNGNLISTTNAISSFGALTHLRWDKDEHGNIYIGGNLGGNIVFNGDTSFSSPLYGPDELDIVLMKFRPDGQQLWMERFYSPDRNNMTGLDVDGNTVMISINVFTDSICRLNGDKFYFNNPGITLYKTDTLNMNSEFIKFYETSTSTTISTTSPSDAIRLNDIAQTFDFAFIFDNSFTAPGNVSVNKYPTSTYRNFGIYHSGYDCTFSPIPTNGGEPIAYFLHPNMKCTGDTLQFSDASLNNPTSWNWTFSGANITTSNLQNPKVVFNSPGTFQVTLVAENSNGTSNVYTQNVVINQTPNVQITGDSLVCPNANYVYNASGASTYSWNTGSTATSIMLWFYQDPDSLLILNGTALGCSNSDSILVSIISEPGLMITGITSDTICTTDNNFQISGNPAGGDLYDYWSALDFSGNYDPSIVSDGEWNWIYYDYENTTTGCWYQIIDSIYTVDCAIQPPVASFTYNSNFCENDTVYFFDNSTFGPTSWVWDFNGGFSPDNSLENPIAIFTPGNYTVSLQTFNANGASNIYSQNITINPNPIVVLNPFVPDTICQTSMPLIVPFASPSGGVYSDLYGSVNGVQFNPAIGPTGNRFVTYTYTDNNGCVGMDSSAIYIDICNGIEHREEELKLMTRTVSNGQYILESDQKIKSIIIYNAIGQKISTIENEKNSISINISSEASGIYFVIVHFKNNSKMIKLFK